MNKKNQFFAYSGGTAATVVGTANVGLQLWNGSLLVNLVLKRVGGLIAVTSASTTGIVLAGQPTQAAAPTSTTAITKVGSLNLDGTTPLATAYNAGTFTTAPVIMRTLMHNTAAIATTGEDSGFDVDLGSNIIVPPLAYVSISALGGTAAASALYSWIHWEEVPV